MWLGLSSNQMWRFITSETDGWTRYIPSQHILRSVVGVPDKQIASLEFLASPHLLIQFTPFLSSLPHDPAVCGVMREREGKDICCVPIMRWNSLITCVHLAWGRETYQLLDPSLSSSLPPCLPTLRNILSLNSDHHPTKYWVRIFMI